MWGFTQRIPGQTPRTDPKADIVELQSSFELVDPCFCCHLNILNYNVLQGVQIQHATKIPRLFEQYTSKRYHRSGKTPSFEKHQIRWTTARVARRFSFVVAQGRVPERACPVAKRKKGSVSFSFTSKGNPPQRRGNSSI